MARMTISEPCSWKGFSPFRQECAFRKVPPDRDPGHGQLVAEAKIGLHQRADRVTAEPFRQFPAMRCLCRP